MKFDISAARHSASSINEKLEPIAHRPVDINDPNWVQTLRNTHPLDEAGVRQEAENLLRSLLEAYAAGDRSLRKSIRELLSENSAFAWATGVPEPATTYEGFRWRLLRMSALDQAQELRDAVLMLNELCINAKSAGIDAGAVLDEIAALSGDTATSSFGSLRDIFLHARVRWG